MKKKLTFILVILISTLLVFGALAFNENKEAIFRKAAPPKYRIMPEENFGLLPLGMRHLRCTGFLCSQARPTMPLAIQEAENLMKLAIRLSCCELFAINGIH